MDLAAPADWPEPVTLLNPGGRSPIVLICDHASNHIPAEYHGLGLPADELRRHIAWDVGAADVTRGLSAALDAPALLGGFSRLLMDLNRPLGVPGSIPILSEATEIPGNRDLDPAEISRRRRLMFEPFHAAVSRLLDARRTAGVPTALVAIHSFTPVFLGVARPWHAGVLYDRSEIFARAVLGALGRDNSLTLGLNVPYTIGREDDYAAPVHGTDRGLPVILVEIRNDLIGEPEGTTAWTGRLADALTEALRADIFRPTPQHAA